MKQVLPCMLHPFLALINSFLFFYLYNNYVEVSDFTFLFFNTLLIFFSKFHTA